MREKSIGFIEYRSVAIGIKATDQMLKSAEVELMLAQTVCPGKYIVMLSGKLSAIKSAIEQGKTEEFLEVWVDDYILGNPHSSIFDAIYGSVEIGEVEALGILETYSAASVVGAADSIVKTTPVKLIEIRIARGMSGKSYVLFCGELASVEASMEKACKEFEQSGLLFHHAVIPRPDEQLWEHIV